MKPEENATPHQGLSDQENHFDIHQKLKQHIKEAGESLAYMMLAQPYQDDANIEFITRIYPELLFLVYERHDGYFVLVDFFKNYAEACEEAKLIIDQHPEIKASLNAWVEHSKNN